MKKYLILTTVFLLCGFTTMAQVAEVSEGLKEVYHSMTATFYTFNYPSKNAAGEDVVLSSLLIAWSPEKPTANDGIESLHIYSHYTITANKECPSSDHRLLFSYLVKDHYGTGDDPTTNYISRCVVIAPDFQGYGVSSHLNHPYLSQELTAQQVIDGVKYGLKLYQKQVNDQHALPFKSDWRSFSYGYSQGGAVALAVHRYIEQNGLSDELHFRGSICGDGPYDLIATMRYYLEDDGNSYDTETTHRKGLMTLPMVIPMIIQGMLDTHPDMKEHQLEDYLSQQFLDTGIMEWLANKEMTNSDMSKKWYEQLQSGLDAGDRHYSKEQMAELFVSPGKNTVWARLDKVFTPDFYEYLSTVENFNSVPEETGDTWADIHRAMVDNSLSSGWEPQHRIQFVHSKGDMVVPYGNYLAFRDAHPTDEGNLYRIDDSLSPKDHVDVGTIFFTNAAVGNYGDYFKWIDEGSDITGIKELDSMFYTHHSSSSTEDWYDLQGRRLSGKPTAKGIYIYKGKKTIIK